jgi:hypothetical protein
VLDPPRLDRGCSGPEPDFSERFLAVGLIGLLGTPAAATGKPAVTVYKEPT